MTDDSKGPYRVEEGRGPATMAFEVSSNTRMIGFYETRLSAIMACNAANAAHAAGVAQERAKREWRPIETAPKDGTRIWIWGTRTNSDEGFYSHSACRWDKRIGCWRDAFGILTVASHWVPLPEPPAIRLPDGRET